MADKPIEATVEAVVKSEAWTGNDGPMVTDEVMFVGDGRTWKVHRPADSEGPVDGAVLRGWKNEGKGTFGIAKDKPQNGAGRGTGGSYGGKRDDATHESIQRQTAAKAAAEMAAAIGGTGPIVLANFEEFFEAVHAKIAGQSDAS